MHIIDRAEGSCLLQHWSPIAADDPPLESALFHRQPEGATNEASPDDRDLANWHLIQEPAKRNLLVNSGAVVPHIVRCEIDFNFSTGC